MAMRRVAGEAVRLMVAAIVGAALAQRPTPVPPPTNAPPVRATLEETAEVELKETEQIFAYQVLADAARRSLDGVRFIDALLAGLLAAQAAILAVYVDKARSGVPFAAAIVRPMDWALIAAATGLLLTLGTREGPDAVSFAETFPKDPWAARNAGMKLFEAVVGRNEALRVLKMVCFVVSLGVTLWDVLAATGFARLGSGG
jgi:hypothetical protein